MIKRVLTSFDVACLCYFHLWLIGVIKCSVVIVYVELFILIEIVSLSPQHFVLLVNDVATSTHFKVINEYIAISANGNSFFTSDKT